jgi:hypothetical protein
MKKKYFFPLMLWAALGLGACDKQEAGSARLQVRLTDAPGDYDEVNVDVRSVQIHKSDGAGEEGWVTLPQINPGVYNLLDFANGRDTLLASADLPSGRISQIRLVLGDNNSLKLKGQAQRIPLTTPSGQAAGLKVKINADLREDVTYVVLLDFDAARSVVKRGNGGYNLKPVIRTLTEAVAGGIRGTVTPAAAKPGIYVISANQDTIGGFADDYGRFLIKGVPAGTYTVKFYTTDPYVDKTLTNVSVSNDRIQELGTVDINY